MENINKYGMSLEEAYSVIKDFRSNPSRYVIDLELMGEFWITIVDSMYNLIYAQFCRDYRDDVIEGAEALKSGMYSDRILEIIEEFGIQMFK